VIAPKWLS